MLLERWWHIAGLETSVIACSWDVCYVSDDNNARVLLVAGMIIMIDDDDEI